MTLDSDGDGVVSMAEYEAAVREQFNHVDKDRDGRIPANSANSAIASTKRAKRRNARARRKSASSGCRRR
jgi:hypothetical protein